MDRADRLLDKAEEATDRGDIDQSEQYMFLADRAIFLRRLEVKHLTRLTRRRRWWARK